MPESRQVLDHTGVHPESYDAAKKLAELLGCERTVVFGDAENDLDMFRAADERYAVANAVPEVISAADGVIGANGEDGVARFLRGALGI